MNGNLVSPDIFLFNPSCDFAVGSGSPYWQPGKLIRTMEYDLGNLSQFLCKPGDMVLTPRLPSPHLIKAISHAGFQVPQFVEFNTHGLTHPVPEKYVNWLRPWGWSPVTHRQLSPFKPNCSRDFLASPMSVWNPQLRKSFSRDTAAAALHLILKEDSHPSFMDPVCQPRICRNLSDLEPLAALWGKLMLKMPWSSSGRGLQPITKFPPHPSLIQRISGMIRAQGHILAEPLHQKVADLAFLYEVTGDKITFSGYSRFFTDNKGQYKGNYLNGWPASFPEEIKNFAAMVEDFLPELHIRVFERLKICDQYRGPIGVDILIFKDINGHLKINPLQEINWRYTMGNISLNIEKTLHRQSCGVLGILFDPRTQFRETAQMMYKTNPPILRRDKISSGYLPLTEFTSENHFGAYIRVAKTG